MTESDKSTPRISDPDFSHAVRLVDTGDVDALAAWLDAHPHLLELSADEDGSFAGDYFAQPKLLWFVAENPVRNGALPANIADVAQTIIDGAREQEVTDLQGQLDYTLNLVMSGRVARECDAQAPLAGVLIGAGARPDSAIRAALSHGELAASEILLEHGAELSVPVAAALGRVDDLRRLTPTAKPEMIREGLVLAAVNGEPETLRMLLDHGLDPNEYNPPGLHPHCTPLHLAVDSGNIDAVRALLARGADPGIEDRLHNATALEWARHLGRDVVVDVLTSADSVLPAISAVREGRVEDLRGWLEAHGERLGAMLAENPRTLLHYATDWPGGWPRAAETIALLASFGANVNARYVGPATSATETPLHWAASSDDVDAAAALIAAGAELDPDGGCIGNGSPLMLAVIFGNWRVAEMLVEAGATLALPFVAGMGRMDLVTTFFDDDGAYRNPYPSLPFDDSAHDAKRAIDSALCLAARGGHENVVRLLLEKDADINTRSPVGTTPLDEAENNGHDTLAAVLIAAGGKRVDELP